LLCIYVPHSHTHTHTLVGDPYFHIGGECRLKFSNALLLFAKLIYRLAHRGLWACHQLGQLNSIGNRPDVSPPVIQSVSWSFSQSARKAGPE